MVFQCYGIGGLTSDGWNGDKGKQRFDLANMDGQSIRMSFQGEAATQVPQEKTVTSTLLAFLTVVCLAYAVIHRTLFLGRTSLSHLGMLISPIRRLIARQCGHFGAESVKSRTEPGWLLYR